MDHIHLLTQINLIDPEPSYKKYVNFYIKKLVISCKTIIL